MSSSANRDPLTSEDPYVEPPASTVDDWLGQSVDRDSELAERLLDEEGRDEQDG